MSLKLEKLTVGYRRRPVFRDLSLPAIEPGALVAVVGPNAVGKTSFARTLGGLWPLQKGQLTVPKPAKPSAVAPDPEQPTQHLVRVSLRKSGALQ